MVRYASMVSVGAAAARMSISTGLPAASRFHAQHRVVEAVLVLVVGYVVTELERQVEAQLFLRHGRHRDAPREHCRGNAGRGRSPSH